MRSSGIAAVATAGVLAALLQGAATVPIASGAPRISPRNAPDGVLGSWSSLSGGVNNTVNALVFTDDTLYVGGGFTSAGGGPADDSYVAAWDGSWHSLGAGTNNWVNALAFRDDTLYVGGDFTATNGGLADDSRIAAWDGSWHSLGAGMNGSVHALAFLDDTLVSGGQFTSASGVAGTKRIAVWDDTWHPLDLGIDDTTGIFGVAVYALAVDGTAIYAGGRFASASGTPAKWIAKWDGTWQALGTGTDHSVYSLARRDSTLFVGGDFNSAGGQPGTSWIASWDGTWASVGGGMTVGNVDAIAVDDTRGLVYAAGAFFTAGGIPATSVAVWDTGIQEWIPFRWGTSDDSEGILNPARAIALDDSIAYIGGQFTAAGNVSGTSRIARWTWQPPQGSNALSAFEGASVRVSGEGFVGMLPAGGVSVGGAAATYTRDDSRTITVTLPASLTLGTHSILVTAVGGMGDVGTVTVSAAPPTPPTPVPPGAPRDLVVSAGDRAVDVSWQAPSSSGSFAIGTYQAEASPGGANCLVDAPAMACMIPGLSNGTAYTVRVRALSGAGWGEWSAPSDPVTPVGPTPPAATIVIVGSRGTGANAARVYVSGTTTGLAGEKVRARVRLAGQERYKSGASRAVAADGTFTWQRKSKRRTYVYFKSGTVRSKRVIIPALRPR